jgi:rhamnose transport system substrate-binding protein
MKKSIALLVVLALAVVMFASCQASNQPAATSAAPTTSVAAPTSAPSAVTSAVPATTASATPATTASAAAKKSPGSSGADTYAIVFKNTGNPYGDKQMEGYRIAIEDELGYTCIEKAPQNPTAADQIAIINQLVSQKVSAICVVANDFDALQPACQAAMKAGIKVLSCDSAVNPASRQVFINQADPQAIAQALCDAALDMTGGSGEFAILSATAQASNQNLWIANMKTILKDPKYSGLVLDKVAYGNDVADTSVTETEGLLQAFPNLKCIVAPTTVGIAAAGKVITDKGLKGKVIVTGLGLPSQMAEYIESGVCPYMYLWNPIDVGYLSGYAAYALVQGKITGAVGDKFDVGRLGQKTVVSSTDGGTQVLLGPPFKFDSSNIEDWKNVY